MPIPTKVYPVSYTQQTSHTRNNKLRVWPIFGYRNSQHTLAEIHSISAERSRWGSYPASASIFPTVLQKKTNDGRPNSRPPNASEWPSLAPEIGRKIASRSQTSRALTCKFYLSKSSGSIKIEHILSGWLSAQTNEPRAHQRGTAGAGCVASGFNDNTTHFCINKSKRHHRPLLHI